MSFWLTQGHEFLDNHLSGIPITETQQDILGTLKNEVLSIVGAQEKDTSADDLSVLGDIESHCENFPVDKDRFTRPEILLFH